MSATGTKNLDICIGFVEAHAKQQRARYGNPKGPSALDADLDRIESYPRKARQELAALLERLGMFYRET
jgi:hypothetical protein